MTFLRDMAIAPLDRQTVTIIGSISGVIPTATAIEKKCFAPIVFCQAVDDEHQGHHHKHEADHQPCEFLDAAVETRFLLLIRKAAGDVTEVGVRARRNHDCLGRAALDAVPRKQLLLRSNRPTPCRVSGASTFSTGSDSPVNVA